MSLTTRLPAMLFLLLVLVLTTRGGPARAAEVAPVGAWPLRPDPAVLRGFDPPDVPWGAGHRGVDLLGGAGTRVHAALPGVVSFAGRLAGRGVVVVDHGETRTTYEPVLATVHRGEAVPAGGVLGRLTAAASHCAPRACLHWGWLRGETYLDPLLLVGGGPVRLLPLWRDVPVGTSASPPLPRLPYAGWRPAAESAQMGLRTPAAGLLPLAGRPVRPAGAPAGTPVGGGPW